MVRGEFDGKARRVFLTTTFFAFFSFAVAPLAWGQEPNVAKDDQQESSEQTVEQEVLTFEIHVTGADGQPVPEATITPWALGCSIGHGMWSSEWTGGIEPVAAQTDANGIAHVEYPKYTRLDERVSTTTVSVSISHPDHPYASGEHIGTPVTDPHQFRFIAGAPVEIKAMINGQLDSSEGIRVLSTSGQPGGSKPTVTDEGRLRLSPLAKGQAKVMLVKLDGETATHFSSILDIQVDPDKGLISKDVELKPAINVSGKLSSNVPRPVKNGRVKVSTIEPEGRQESLAWDAWAKVNEDGTFQIEGWPADEPMQMVALCDGYCGKSGEKPPMVSKDRSQDGFMRAQVFMDPGESEVVMEMAAMVKCNFEVKDAFGKPVGGVTINSNPNVRWWNGGSQIYCFPLMNTSQWVATGQFDFENREGLFAYPFETKSNEQGQATIEFPTGRFLVTAGNNEYQLPIKVGSRYERIEVVAGDVISKTIVVQPKSLEVLGDWEDLCGLVFG